MANNYDRMETKVDKILEKISEIDKTLVMQHEQLAIHIKRTELNEESIQLLRTEVKPIQKHVNLVEYTVKISGLFVAGAATLVGLIAGVLKILEHMKP